MGLGRAIERRTRIKRSTLKVHERRQHAFSISSPFQKLCQDATSSGNKCLPDVALGCHAATPTILSVKHVQDRWYRTLIPSEFPFYYLSRLSM